MSTDHGSGVEVISVFVIGLRGFPNVQGGVETHAENLYPIIAHKGLRVICASRSPFHPRETKRWSGVQFVRIWAPRSSYLEAIVHSVLAVFVAAVQRPDIVHIHAVGPGLVAPLARLFGLRVVVTHHGPDYDREKWNSFARAVLKLGEWCAMRFSNERIVISSVISDMVRRRHSVESHIIPNGVKIPTLDADPGYLEEYGLAKEKYVLLVSRFVPEKRHLDLISAFSAARLDGWKLALVGGADHPGAYDREIKKLAEANLDIVLTGFIGGERLKSIFQHAGIFVLPSSHEGLPIAMLEALSYGLRCVASNIPANLAVGLDESAYFELGNTGELAVKLQQLANTRHADADRVAQRQWVESRYDWRAIADDTITVYKEAARTGKS